MKIKLKKILLSSLLSTFFVFADDSATNQEVRVVVDTTLLEKKIDELREYFASYHKILGDFNAEQFLISSPGQKSFNENTKFMYDYGVIIPINKPISDLSIATESSVDVLKLRFAKDLMQTDTGSSYSLYNFSQSTDENSNFAKSIQNARTLPDDEDVPSGEEVANTGNYPINKQYSRSAKEMVVNHFKKYFAAKDKDIVNELVLPLLGQKESSVEKPMPYADLNIAYLLESSVIMDSSISDEVRMQDAINDLVQNLSAPIVELPLVIEAVGGDGNGVQLKDKSYKKIAGNLLKIAKANTMQYSLKTMQKIREPLNTANNTANAKSLFSIMEDECTRRLGKDLELSGGWQAALSVSSEPALLREIAQIEAFRLWMDFLKFKQSERIEALLISMQAENQLNLPDLSDLGDDLNIVIPS